MRSLPVEILREFRKGYFRKRHFYVFEFLSRTYRFTDADVPIFANLDGTTHWYDPKGISFEVIPVDLENKVASVILTMNNADHKLSDLIFGEDTRNRPCYIYLCLLDNNMNVIDTIDNFYGFCDSIDPVGPEEIEMQVVDHMIKWSNKTLRTHNSTCDWVFTDPNTCCYVGAADVVTAMRVQANPPTTTIEVDSTTGMNVIDSKISIVLDNGRKHWSRILTINPADNTWYYAGGADTYNSYAADTTNFFIGDNITITIGGSLTTIGLKLDSIEGVEATNCKIALYKLSGGNWIVHESKIIAIPANAVGGWYDITLDTPLDVSNGQTIRIGYIFSDAAHCQVIEDSGYYGLCTEISYGLSPPNPWIPETDQWDRPAVRAGINAGSYGSITIRDPIPAGRYAPIDAVVETRRWCDRSRERCEEMVNTDNFGGFPWLPYLEDKKIMWGRETG